MTCEHGRERRRCKKCPGETISTVYKESARVVVGNSAATQVAGESMASIAAKELTVIAKPCTSSQLDIKAVMPEPVVVMSEIGNATSGPDGISSIASNASRCSKPTATNALACAPEYDGESSDSEL